MSSFFEKVKAKFSKKRKMAERNGPSGEGAGKGACEEEKEEEDAITKTFCRISGKDSCRDAVERMKEARVSACLVVSNSGILEAIFTERDTVRAVASATVPLAEVAVERFATANPVTLVQGSSEKEALQIMHARKFRHLPVVTSVNAKGGGNEVYGCYDILLLAQGMLASAGANGCSSRESKRQKTSASGGDAVIEDIDSGGDWKAKTSSNTFAPGLMREEFKFITRQFKFMKKLIGFGKKEEAGPGVDSSSFAVDATLVPASGKGHPGALCRQDSLRDDGCNRLRVPGLCLETATVREAAQLMESGRHSALLITHADGTLAGILTERDILRRVASVGRDADATRVQDVMTSDPDFITLETSAMEALSMMLERRYRHLPVVEVESAGAVASTSTIARPPLRPVALVDILSLTFTSAASVIEASSSKVHSEKAEVEAAPTSEHAADAASAASAAAAAADASGIKTAASASAMASGPFARARDALDAIAALTAKGLRSARISKFEGSDGAGAHFKKARRKALVAQRLIQRLSQSGTAEAKENVAELSLRFLALQLWSLHNHGQIQVFTNMVSDGVSTLEEALNIAKDAAKQCGDGDLFAGARALRAACPEDLSHFSLSDLLFCLGDVLTDSGVDRYEQAGEVLSLLPTGDEGGHHRSKLVSGFSNKLDSLMALGKEQYLSRSFADATTYYTLAVRLATVLSMAVPPSGVGAAPTAEREFVEKARLLRPRVFSNRAACAMNEGKYAHAVSDCRACIAADTTFAKGWSRLSTCMLRTGRIAEAEAVALDGMRAVGAAGGDTAALQQCLDAAREKLREERAKSAAAEVAALSAVVGAEEDGDDEDDDEEEDEDDDDEDEEDGEEEDDENGENLSLNMLAILEAKVAKVKGRIDDGNKHGDEEARKKKSKHLSQ